MKLFKILIASSVLSSIFFYTGYCDTVTRNFIGRLISEGKIEEARKKVNEILLKNPQDVDAIMMKGNIILNDYMNKIGFGHLSLSVNQDESIYNNSIGYLGISQTPVVLSKEIADKVSEYWLKCIRLAPSRKDIYEGMCYLYSEALMKDELTKMLKIFKDGFPGDDLKYIMGDYARMFLDRDYKKEGMEIYLYVSKLYPDEAGLLSDIAATYFKLGEVCQATNYLELCINASNKDDMVYNNYSFINFVMGDYEKSIAGVKNVKNAGNLWELYQGLYYYYLDNPQWYSKLSNFICNNTIKDGVELAKFLISKENLNDYNSFIKSKDKDKGIYNLLLYKRAIKKFPEEYQPYFLYAERMTYYKNYEEAIKIFNLAEGKNIFLNNEEKSLQNYYYGWALQDSGKLYEASKKWLNLLDSVNFQYKSAACYFYGKYLMNSGRNEEAIKIFEKVSDDANKSKFATYCWNLLSTLKNWK